MFKQFLKTLVLGFTSGAACIAGQKLMNKYMDEQEKKKQQNTPQIEEEEEVPKMKKRK